MIEFLIEWIFDPIFSHSRGIVHLFVKIADLVTTGIAKGLAKVVKIIFRIKD